MSVKFIKKFINCKDIPINSIIGNFEDDNTLFTLHKQIFEIKSHKNLLQITNIQDSKFKNYSYKILKDDLTNAWFLTSNDLLILTIMDKDYYKIELFLAENTQYIFCVYKIINAYILICVSHTIDKIKNPTAFLYDNHCIYSHLLLSKLLNSFIVLNDSFLDTCIVGENNEKYDQYKKFTNIKMVYEKLLGKGVINKDLLDLSNIISAIKNHYKFLPKHFLFI